MRQPPLDMGDAFVVDDGDLGITIKAKGSKPWQEIIAAWPEEERKKWSYGDYETLMFFNEMGTENLVEWLEGRFIDEAMAAASRREL